MTRLVVTVTTPDGHTGTVCMCADNDDRACALMAKWTRTHPTFTVTDWTFQ